MKSYLYLRKIIEAGILIVALVMSTQSIASVITYTNETDFQNALTNGFTLVNLDAPPLNQYASGYRVEDIGPSSDFASLGIDFQFVNAEVLAGQAYQLPKAGRDRIINNGIGWNGNIVFDLLSPMNGIGAWSNFGDGGIIKAYDGLGLTGSLIGVANLNGGSFGGLISIDLVRSVEITCDFNADLRCGVFDIQSGTTISAVPAPATIWLIGSGLLGFFGMRTNLTSRCLTQRSSQRSPDVAALRRNPGQT